MLHAGPFPVLGHSRNQHIFMEFVVVTNPDLLLKYRSHLSHSRYIKWFWIDRYSSRLNTFFLADVIEKPTFAVRILSLTVEVLEIKHFRVDCHITIFGIDRTISRLQIISYSSMWSLRGLCFVPISHPEETVIKRLSPKF